MSSFVIDKVEYIKAAGVIAGIYGIKKRREGLWLYDYTNHKRICSPEDLYELFEGFYMMNLRSVEEQYNEPKTPGDGLKYSAEFTAYRKKGINAVINSRTYFGEILVKLNTFFQGALYQIENEEYNTAMKNVFYTILSDLIEYYLPREFDGWSRFDLE